MFDVSNSFWIWCVIFLALLFFLGFVVGRFTKVWNPSKYPIVGTMFINGKELYVNFDQIKDLNELTQNEAVIIKVSAKNASAKME